MRSRDEVLTVEAINDRIRELEAQQAASEPVACKKCGGSGYAIDSERSVGSAVVGKKCDCGAVAYITNGDTPHPSAAAVTPCEWKLDDPDFSLYHTDCGNDFTLNEDGPVENRMAFCCYCGKPMKAQRIRPTTPTRGSDA